MKVKTQTHQPEEATGESVENAPAVASPSGPGQYTLSNGVMVTLAKPRGAQNLRIFEMLGENSTNNALLLSYKALMSITHIDGRAEAAPQNKPMVEMIAAQIGDDQLFELIDLYAEHIATKAQDVRPLS